jgi:hypothetical protein
MIGCNGPAATRPAERSPGGCGGSATSGRMAVGRAGREVQRLVHPLVSRQYQRTSWQALPPSATIWRAGKRMPHIQHDLTWAAAAPNGAGSSRSVMTCSPRSPTGRAEASARAAGPPTAAVRSASRSAVESPTLMRTLPLHPGERRAPLPHLPAVETGGLTIARFQSPTVLTSDHRWVNKWLIFDISIAYLGAVPGHVTIHTYTQDVDSVLAGCSHRNGCNSPLYPLL